MSETGLYVETSRTEAEAPGAEPPFTEAEATSEAGRCLDCQCMECVKGCAFMAHYKRYPKLYAREVYNNLAIVMGNRTSNTLINSCALCSQCKAICPNGFDLGGMIQEARRVMAEAEKMPASAFEFALLDLEHAMGSGSFLSRPQPGFDKVKYVFFPGCQLGASAPEVVKRAYLHLQGA